MIKKSIKIYILLFTIEFLNIYIIYFNVNYYKIIIIIIKYLLKLIMI